MGLKRKGRAMSEKIYYLKEILKPWKIQGKIEDKMNAVQFLSLNFVLLFLPLKIQVWPAFSRSKHLEKKITNISSQARYK